MFATLYSSCQSYDQCFFDDNNQYNLTQIKNFENMMQKIIKSNKSEKSIHLKKIPIVVHIIHDGGVSNISNNQIYSQIEVLNEDFRKKKGTLGDGNGIDTEIEFCLAKKTPDGKCTNGIVRINSNLSNHQTYQRSKLKELSSWDSFRYLNIYVVKDINNGSGVKGYASFPGGPINEDGVVIKHDSFGRIGTAVNSYGRTTTHEIGHWLGLYHTFNKGCGSDVCLDGDFVCDTPPSLVPNYGCKSINSCSNDLPDINDQIENYMDYSDGKCKNMFTNGQKQRMQITLSNFRESIWQIWNLDSTGCNGLDDNNQCAVIADFTTINQTICESAKISFINKSQNSPLSYNWYFDGGFPNSSNDENPIVTYSNIGRFKVKLIAKNLLGVDSLVLLNYIDVKKPEIGIKLPFYENFETKIFPPVGIKVENPDEGISWVLDTIAKAYEGNGSVKINNLINVNYGQSDALILPSFDLTSFKDKPYLKFQWAYARSDNNYSDELIVLVSVDCGTNWVQKFYKKGKDMSTSQTQSTPYIPDSTTIWKNAIIDLSSFISYNNVIIKIVNVTDGGNNLYIDNIIFGDKIAEIHQFDLEHLSSNLRIFPNPIYNRFTIESFNLKNKTVSLTISNLNGEEIYNSSVEFDVNGNFIFEDTNIFKSSGIYNLNIETDDININRKCFVIIK